MPKIIIDGREIECREGIPVLQAALEAGMAIPHYCYHPGLSVVASCRLCLMEMKMPHPKTREMVWAPKLVPSCQTPVKDGMEVRFQSETVRANQRHVMEYYLLNHPLDCPVCDKAGECYLQDYTEAHAAATSRMVEDKQKNPKKDIGSHTLLYSDRCVMCTRCVRFADEIAGSGELRVVNRGSTNEIDVFPGRPLENPLQGNVVDLCPVGALLDKDFLFKQRVWRLNSTKSVSPADSRGATIFIDHNEEGIHRIRPRFNEKVNEWWLSDEARFGWRYVHSPERLCGPQVREGGTLRPARWEELPALLRERLAGKDGVAAVLSPMLSCEEAWLLVRFIRDVAPRATLVTGFVPVDGEDRVFPKGFVIKAEKCPNRRGVERIVEHAGGTTMSFGDFVAAAGSGRFQAAYVTGGYPRVWVDDSATAALSKIPLLVLHDLFASRLAESASVLIPGATWAEREGTFMNCDGLLQPFERALPPLEGVKADGQFFHELAGLSGLFRAAKVREAMAAAQPEFGQLHVPQELPKHAH
ncbi:MAG: 2Fe-2S iron-sulfur cluster-binding protein [Phycisphaerae bacterium]|jgi:NADH-quinone oxidoreductase subunit G